MKFIFAGANLEDRTSDICPCLVIRFHTQKYDAFSLLRGVCGQHRQAKLGGGFQSQGQTIAKVSGLDDATRCRYVHLGSGIRRRSDPPIEAVPPRAALTGSRMCSQRSPVTVTLPAAGPLTTNPRPHQPNPKSRTTVSNTFLIILPFCFLRPSSFQPPDRTKKSIR